MDTVLYHLEARRVKVSGGADLISFVPARESEPVGGQGQVLDFELCRRRLETKAARQALPDAAREEDQEEAVEEPEDRSRRRDGLGSALLELAATGAVLLTALSASLAFLACL